MRPALSTQSSRTQQQHYTRAGPGHAFAKVIIKVGERPVGRGCSIELHWTPAHKWVGGNGVAEFFAKAAACYSVGRRYLQESSLAHLTRKTTKAKNRSTRANHVKSSRRYRPPRGSGIRADLRNELSYYQLLSGHASIDSHLADRTNTIRPDECRWCDSGEMCYASASSSGAEPGSCRAEKCGRKLGGRFLWRPQREDEGVTPGGGGRLRWRGRSGLRTYHFLCLLFVFPLCSSFLADWGEGRGAIWFCGELSDRDGSWEKS